MTNKEKQTQECSVTTRITVLWGDYSFTWYRCGCIWSWLYLFTQLWKIIIINITQQNRHERQKQNNFRNPNYHQVESYLLFSEKEMLIKSVIRFHTFTSCDITSIFWRKGKVHLLHFILENPDFIATFLELGNNWEIDNNTLLNARSFVFTMYGCVSFNNVNMSGMSRYYVMLNQSYSFQTHTEFLERIERLMPDWKTYITISLKKSQRLHLKHFQACIWIWEYFMLTMVLNKRPFLITIKLHIFVIYFYIKN